MQHLAKDDLVNGIGEGDIDEGGSPAACEFRVIDDEQRLFLEESGIWCCGGDGGS